MKLGHLAALPFAMIADLCTLGDAGATDQVLRDARRDRELEAAENIAKALRRKD